jgi:hypothetical protein
MSMFKYRINRKLFSTNYRDAKNPKVFFTISKNGTQLGNLTFEVNMK